MDAVVRIHQIGMGYTLNARLGPEHLRYLYGTMMNEPGCYLGVCHMDGVPAGVVSGTIDAARLSTRLLRRMPAARLLRTSVRMILAPELLWLWAKGSVIAQPVRMDGAEVRAVLTAIVVDPHIQGHGIGRGLVAAFEAFLRRAGIQVYRLDTQIRNERAERFYRGLGFVEVGRRADSIIFVRRVPA